jgi:hypothetical protein
MMRISVFAGIELLVIGFPESFTAELAKSAEQDASSNPEFQFPICKS